MVDIILLRRAAFDIEEIERTSISKWGKKVADDYLDSMDEALQMLSEQPELLRKFENSDHLSFTPYVNIVCFAPDAIIQSMC